MVSHESSNIYVIIFPSPIQQIRTTGPIKRGIHTNAFFYSVRLPLYKGGMKDFLTFKLNQY